jgi:hypothetical protein
MLDEQPGIADELMPKLRERGYSLYHCRGHESFQRSRSSIA